MTIEPTDNDHQTLGQQETGLERACHMLLLQGAGRGKGQEHVSSANGTHESGGQNIHDGCTESNFISWEYSGSNHAYHT